MGGPAFYVSDKKKEDKILRTEVGYELTYYGPIDKSNFGQKNFTNYSFTDKGQVFLGTMAVTLTDKLDPTSGRKAYDKDGNQLVDFKLTIKAYAPYAYSLSYDSSNGGAPAVLHDADEKGNSILYCPAMKIDTENFNKQFPNDGDKRIFKNDKITEDAYIEIYRIPDTTGVDGDAQELRQGISFTTRLEGKELVLNIDGAAGTAMNIGIYDVSGKQVASPANGIVKNSDGEERFGFDLGGMGLGGGIYFISVQSSAGNASQQVIIQQ